MKPEPPDLPPESKHETFVRIMAYIFAGLLLIFLAAALVRGIFWMWS